MRRTAQNRLFLQPRRGSHRKHRFQHFLYFCVHLWCCGADRIGNAKSRVVAVLFPNNGCFFWLHNPCFEHGCHSIWYLCEILYTCPITIWNFQATNSKEVICFVLQTLVQTTVISLTTIKKQLYIFHMTGVNITGCCYNAEATDALFAFLYECRIAYKILVFWQRWSWIWVTYY
jgi:hypothetical protein